MWVQHAHWHPRLLEAVKGSERVLSIVRDPAHRFASAWHWYGLEQEVGTDLASFALSYRTAEGDATEGRGRGWGWDWWWGWGGGGTDGGASGGVTR